jgi:hypothetical protein
MEVLYERCAGLDVHQATVVACVRRPGTRGRRANEVRTFGTTTAELLTLADWLTAEGVGHVAMESTGVFWKPVFNILEGSVAVILVNAQHIKAVPGRKTDVRDCEWIAQLLEHGPLRPSFIPPAPIRARRDLPRHRKVLVQQRASEANRVQKLLEAANIKLKLVVPVEKVIRAGEAFRIGSENVRAGTYTDADTGCSARMTVSTHDRPVGADDRGGAGRRRSRTVRPRADSGDEARRPRGL